MKHAHAANTSAPLPTAGDRAAAHTRAQVGIEAIRTTARATDDDGELLALRPLWLKARAALQAAHTAHTPIEEAFFARAPSFPKDPTDRSAWKAIEAERRRVRKAVGLDKAEARQTRAENAEIAIICRIADTPARTLAGLALKAEVSTAEEHNGVGNLIDAVMADILAIDTQTRTEASGGSAGAR